MPRGRSRGPSGGSISAAARAARVLPAARAAAAATTTTARATAAAATAAALLRLVHAQRASAHVLPVEALDRARSVAARHLDEAEAARAAGVAVVDQGDRLDLAMLLEQLANGRFVRRERQVAHVNLGHLHSLTDGVGRVPRHSASDRD